MAIKRQLLNLMGQTLLYHLKNWRNEGLISTIKNVKRNFPFGPTGMRYWVTRVRNRNFPLVFIVDKHTRSAEFNIYKINEVKSTKPEYNVKDYGAVGDGSADDSDAFETAIQKADGGGKLYVPAGEYLIEPNVINIFRGDVLIEGEGQESVLRITPMNYDNWGRYGFINIRGSGINNRIENVHIKNITIDGNKNAHEGTSGSCHELIRFSLAQNCSAVNITAKNAPDDAIQTHGSRWTLIASCDCFNNNGFGIHISEENFHVSTQNIVLNNEVRNCGFKTEHGGIDQTPHSFNNIYVGNTVSDCYMNYRIYGKGAIFKQNKSLGETQFDDIFSGVNKNAYAVFI